MQWFRIRLPHGGQRQAAEYEELRYNNYLYNIIKDFQKAAPETHTERQVTQHGCLPACKGIEIVYGEEKIFCTGPTRAEQPMQNKDLLHRHDPFHLYSLSPN